VKDLDYQAPFNFDGKIDKLTIHLEPTKLTENEHRMIMEARAIAHD
jgi:hypothetical protein